MRFTRLLPILLSFCQLSFGQSWQDTLSRINTAFSRFQLANPGCQLSVSRNGQIIFSGVWGMADMEHKVLLSSNSQLEAGSVSKQFTAAAILLLEQQGKLSLNDDIRKYIPEMPDYGHPIQIHHLLHHTSGLREWSSVVRLTGWPRGKKFYTNEDVLNILIHQKRLNNIPGAEFLYSNSNYNLLAVIVQRVSGVTLAKFSRRYIFEPAGMTHTEWRDDPNKLVLNRAIAYSKTDSTYETDMPNEYVYGQGGLLTTTEDLLKWCNYYQQGRLGNPSLLSRQLQTEPLNNGEMNIYGAGLFIRTVKGWKSINHDGATASYRAYLESFPELNLSYAVLSNTSEFNIRQLAGKISDVFVSDKTERTIEKDNGVSLPEASLQLLAGLYKNERDNSTFQLSVKDGKLVLDNELPLTTVSARTFKAGNFVFVMRAAGKGWYIPSPPDDTIPFTKVEPAAISKKYFPLYTGEFFSEETNTSIVVRADDGQLRIFLEPDKGYPLIPTYKDAFKVNELDCDLQYGRNNTNHVVTIKAYFFDARGVEFRKVK